MTSSPLLTSVAEFVVMTRPIAKLGWASACSGVTSASSARVRPRNGPPLAVTTSRRTSCARPPRRHCAMALCSESTGTIWPGPAAALTSGPPMISDSLLASASTEPAASAARVGRSPIEPVTPLSTTSAPQPAATVAASGPTTTSVADAGRPASAAAAASAARTSSASPRAAATSGTSNCTAWRASRSRLPPADSAATVKRSGWRRHHLEGLGADRAGGAEEGDAAGGHEPIVIGRRP